MDPLSDGVLNHLRDVINLPCLEGTRYELLGEIGRGGMGTVYRARDTQLDRTVALKVLNLGEGGGDSGARLTQEARILARLEHPGIVPVHDAGVLPDGRAYYVMKMVQGRRLDEYARSKPSLPDLLRVFCRISEPVALAHSSGVIHRDLKPANIMVGTFGEVLVLDWGVAKVLSGTGFGTSGHASDHVATGQVRVIGTRDYMAPEQASGSEAQVDARSDIFALGKTLSFLLECTREPSVVPKPLRAICLKATRSDPRERYASALEMAADVARYLDSEPVAAYRETVFEKAGRLASRNKTAIALVLAYLVMRFVIFLLVRR